MDNTYINSLFTIDEITKKKTYNWEAIFEDFNSQNMSIRDYCEYYHICKSSFYQKKAEMDQGSLPLDQKNHERSQMFKPVRVVQDETISFVLDGHSIRCGRDLLPLIIKSL